MAKKIISGLSYELLRSSVGSGLNRAYRQVRVDPDKYMRHLRRAHRLPIAAWEDAIHISPGVLRPHADKIIRGSARAAALEGMGLGFGGIFTAVPDMGILSAITIRLLQKLSLLHGFQFATEDEVVELWIAAASAAGLDLGREFLEKQALERLVPRIIDLIATKISADFAEKWAGSLVPIVSAGAGGALNYYFVRAWGRRAQRHFAERHSLLHADRLAYPAVLPLRSLPS